nr:7-cyano-7-deazaguanine synthase [Salinigranum halophilum]
MECGYDPLFLCTSYSQRTENKGFESAQKLAEVVDTDMDDEEIPTSYVPFRNANPLSIAASYTEAHGASALLIGAYSEGFAGSLDCRPAFFEAFQ